MTLERVTLLVVLAAARAGAQSHPDISRERAAFSEWLTGAPTSPYAALAHAELGRGGLTLGPPDSDIPLEGIGRVRVVLERGALRLESPGSTRSIPRGRDVPLGRGPYRLRVGGDSQRSMLTVYGAHRGAKPAEYYEPSAAAVYVGEIEPPQSRERRRLLGLDGVEAEATLAGLFALRTGILVTRLTVYRIPEPGTDESELWIYFRDSTNLDATYPAGRFVALEPLAGGRYRLDFNRARNPFCAYNTVFPCPAPWPGNAIPARIEAGERYSGERE
jgi:hypothetical protein